MIYRAHIDGLRAIAVVPVLLFHAGLDAFRGGFIGVDIFFVISGYLIGSIILDDIEQKRFSIIRFYERRIRRIMPPLLITIIITVIATPFVYSPGDIKNVGQSVIASLFFIANYYFYLKTDYFNEFTNIAPLLHLWSLSVEEQFYILFPPLMLAFAFFPNHRFAAIIFIAILSFAFSVYESGNNRILNFYSLHTRAWELLFGVIIATRQHELRAWLQKSRFITSSVADMITFASLLALVFSFVSFNSDTSHPSIPTLLPVVATGILIMIAPYSRFGLRLLEARLLVGIGLISYGLYMYHNPIFSIISYTMPYSENTTTVKLLYLLVIFPMAIVSYFCVERPIRSSARVSRSYLIPAIATLSAVLLTFGFSAHRTNGFLEYYRAKLYSSGGIVLVDVELEQELRNRSDVDYAPSDSPFSCDGACKRITVMGDSFSRDAYRSMRMIETEQNLSVRWISFDDECMGVPEISKELNRCRGEDVDFSLLSSSDIIIISARWRETTFANGFNFARQLARTYDIPVHVVGSIVFEDISSFSIRVQNFIDDRAKLDEMSFRSLRWDDKTISDKLRDLVKSDEKLSWIEKFEFFCAESQARCKLFDERGEALIWDNSHLTTRAFKQYGVFLHSNLYTSAHN